MLGYALQSNAAGHFLPSVHGGEWWASPEDFEREFRREPHGFGERWPSA
jgi:hypothetical protein